MLFAFFGTWAMTLGVAAGAASIPIIIHLLNRRRFRIVIWAAMKFLLAAQKQNTRRMRLEQLILLAVRVLLVLLMVGAMASVSPWAENMWANIWPEGAGFIKVRSGRTHKIIVLDASMSMNLLGSGGSSAFERARDLAVRMVKESPAGDAFSVALMKETPDWIVAGPSQDAHKVMDELKLLHATHGNASVAAMLNMIATKVGESAGRFPSREVYFFTDMQQATWLASQSSSSPLSGKTPLNKDGKPALGKTPLQDIQKHARTFFVDVGRDGAGNLAVTGLKLNDSLVTTGDLVSFSGNVQNFGQENRKARVALLVGRAGEDNDSLTLRVERQELREIKPGENAPVPFGYKFTAPGVYAVQMRLLGDDAGKSADDLPPDNARTIIVTVRDKVPIMVVNGKPAADRFDQGAEYLRLSLNPFGNAAPPWVPLRPKVATVAQFSDAAEGDLNGYDCVFLCDVAQLGTGELRRLETHLRRGGGVVVSVGDQVAEHLDLYNRRLYKDGQGILPAKLIKKVQASTDHHFILQASEEAYLEPPLKAFAEDDDRSSLRKARFRQYLQAKPAADVKARTILSFMPEVQPLVKAELDKDLPANDPAVMEWNPPLPRDKEAAKNAPRRYRGKVILTTSTLNMDWNSWPGSPSFGAMMQELTRLAVSGRLRERSVTVGQMIEEYLSTPEAEVDVAIHAPNPEAVHRVLTTEKAIFEGKYRVRDFLAAPQQQRSQGVGDLSVLRWPQTDLSGIYLLSAGRGNEEIPVAVNVPTGTADQQGTESDLTRVDRAKLADAYHGWEFQVITDPRNASHADNQNDEDVLILGGKMGPEVARRVLWVVLFLLFAEVALAWVFGHYSAVAGTEPTPAGGLLPIVVGMIAASCLAVIGYVLIQYGRNGDFLNCWPFYGLRELVERWQGVPKPGPGEASLWDFQRLPFLTANPDDPWPIVGIALVAAAMIFFIYRAEGARTGVAYRLLLGGLRLFMILLVLVIIGPRAEVHFDLQGWPDVVMIIDDSRSMGEPDHYQDAAVQEAVKRLGEQVRGREKIRLPERIKNIQEEIARKKALAQAPDSATRLEIEQLTQKLQNLENLSAQVNSPGWRPTRLQLAQAIVAPDEDDWIRTFVNKRRMKVHVFHLDANGRAIRLTDADGPAGEATAEDDARLIDRANKAIVNLEAEGKESRLGTAIRQVLDYYRGSSLSAVIMLTDGVTTRDETILQVSEYAAQKGVPLYFVGIGDDHPIRDLRLHDLQVDDVVYVNDTVHFEASLTGQGYKDLSVYIVLKVRDENGKEKQVDRKSFKVDQRGASIKVQLKDQPKKAGRRLYIMEVELPKVDRPDKAIPPVHTRLERTIDVLESKLIKVLYVEGGPRYEFRFIKSLLERERLDQKKQRSIELKVVLLDADQDFPAQDRTALADFPPNREELDAYDVVILGDCDPRHPKLGDKRLRNLADFVRGEDSKGRKSTKTGGGLLLIAGPNFNPHAFADTPLAAVLPIEPLRAPPETDDLRENYRLSLTPVGRQHNAFRLSPDDAENLAIWQRLAPMYWWSGGYRTKPLAEVLAVHPFQKAIARNPGQDARHPLAVQMFVGSGRSMFFGFEETWRWRFRENELYFNKFWLETARYLSRNRITRTVLRLDRQTPYRVGEPIKVTVQFPDNAPIPGKQNAKVPKDDVKVIVEFRPNAAGNEKVDPEVQTLKLARTEGSRTNYSEFFTRTREGKYHFWLSSPDVSKEDPGGQKPSADAKVELPPGELDRLRMNQDEMTQAAEATRGRFYNLTNADQLPDELPAGARPSLSTSKPPWLLWNWIPMFLLVLFLLTSEWLLRKRKHLL
jgi:hypothetical protein